MRERLIIVGAGDFGREVHCWASQVPLAARSWDVAGFLDDRPDILTGSAVEAQILGCAASYQIREEDRFVVAIGDPTAKRKYVELLERRGAKFGCVMHPSVIMGVGNSWGEGTIFCPGVVISTNVRIGKHVIFNCQSGAGHDARIGSFSTLSGAVDVTGHVEIGENVMLGSHATVTPRAKVGSNSVVGAGSVVIRNVEPHSTVFGVPAKTVFIRKPAEKI